MGTCSYVLTGAKKGMRETFGSTYHGAGRAMSRNRSRKVLDYKDMLKDLEHQRDSVLSHTTLNGLPMSKALRCRC